MSTAMPGYVFQCHAPPTPSPSSTMTKSRKPASSSLMAAPMPENPAPITTTSWSGAVAVLMRSVPPRSIRRQNRRYGGVPLPEPYPAVLTSARSRCSPRAQPQLEARRRAGQRAQARALGLRERASEVQPDAGAGAARGPALEDPVAVALGDARALVADDQRRVSPVGRDRDRRRATAMAQRVVEQHVEHLADGPVRRARLDGLRRRHAQLAARALEDALPRGVVVGDDGCDVDG